MKDNNKKSFWQQIQDVNAKEQAEAEERELRQRKEEEKKRDVYSKKLQEEKIEVIKAKQNGEAFVPDGVDEVKKEYSKKEKLENFWYYNKKWVFIGAILLAFVGITIYSIVTNVKPDLNVMVITDDYEINEKSDELTEYFLRYAEDFNGDGQVKVIVELVPIGDPVEQAGYAQIFASNLLRLRAEMDIGQTVLFISDNDADTQSDANTIMEDLTEDFTDKTYLTKKGLPLKNTSIPDNIGLTGIDDDIYIGIREYYSAYKTQSDFWGNYNNGRKVLDKIIAESSEVND